MSPYSRKRIHLVQAMMNYRAELNSDLMLTVEIAHPGVSVPPNSSIKDALISIHLSAEEAAELVLDGITLKHTSRELTIPLFAILHFDVCTPKGDDGVSMWEDGFDGRFLDDHRWVNDVEGFPTHFGKPKLKVIEGGSG